MEKILIVDDSLVQATQLKSILENDYEITLVHTAQDGLDYASSGSYSLILLDVVMPDMNGFTLLKTLQEEVITRHIPVILITSLSDAQNEQRGLILGAVDYITKPFNPLELVARVKTQLRRYRLYNGSAPKQEEPAHEYDIRGLVLNRDSHKCFLFGREVQLTPMEFSILWYLCERQGVVVPSEELFEAVWGEKFLKNNNTVMAHIGRLREKLDEPARSPRFIKTVWGVGYTIEK